MARMLALTNPYRPQVRKLMTGTVLLSCSVAVAIQGNSPTTSRVNTSAAGVQADRESVGVAISSDGRYVAFVSWGTNLVPEDTNNYADVFVKDRQTGGIVRASVSASGADPNGDSYAPSISADGRYVAFVSEASNLVSGDKNALADVFVRDLVQGTTVRASASSNNIQANAASENPAISGDGQFVAFQSRASNLVSTDTNNSEDVFVRDLVGASTERVSIGDAGQQGIGDSQTPSISSNGRFVAFASAAGNLLTQPSDTNKSWDVFVRDRVSGTTVRASLASTNSQATGNSTAPSISADGRYVAFESQASDMVPSDTNGRADIFVRDLQNGTTIRASTSSNGTQGNLASSHPIISGDGRYVAFLSSATNLVAGDTNSADDAFVHDCVEGVTTRVSVDLIAAQALGACLWPAISQDGRFVVFACDAANLVPGDTNAETDVFARGPLF